MQCSWILLLRKGMLPAEHFLQQLDQLRCQVIVSTVWHMSTQEHLAAKDSTKKLLVKQHAHNCTYIHAVITVNSGFEEPLRWGGTN